MSAWCTLSLSLSTTSPGVDRFLGALVPRRDALTSFWPDSICANHFFPFSTTILFHYLSTAAYRTREGARKDLCPLKIVSTFKVHFGHFLKCIYILQFEASRVINVDDDRHIIFPHCRPRPKRLRIADRRSLSLSLFRALTHACIYTTTVCTCDLFATFHHFPSSLLLHT